MIMAGLILVTKKRKQAAKISLDILIHKKGNCERILKILGAN